MLKLIHCADLHLKHGDPYSVDVFREIIALTVREKAPFLLCCGDLFDTFADAEALRGELRSLLQDLPFRLLYLPGNHEELEQKKGASLSRLDFGERVMLLDRVPFSLHTETVGATTIEFLAIPHQNDYSSYREWEIPEKKGQFRIALAHGNVPELIEYTGPGDESGGGALDLDLFERNGVDYAALGHIHSGRLQTHGSVQLCYPGSARVWRKGEEGEHAVFLLEAAQTIGVKRFVLGSAGQYRKLTVPVTFDAKETQIAAESKRWGANDWIDVELSGVVEDETEMRRLEEELNAAYAKRVRRFTIDRESVTVYDGISSEPIVKLFEQEWAKRRPETAEELAVWHRAREIALGSIIEKLGR